MATTFEINPIPPGRDANRVRIAVAFTLLALTFALHGDALRMGFGRDDGGGLVQAARLSPADYFFDPPTSAAVSGGSISPWHALVYDVNILLFGLDPYWHHFHLVFVLWLTSLATYFLLRSWLTPGWSLLGTALFLTGAPTVYVSHEEMSGHYLYGLIFCILSIQFFISSESRHSGKYGAASALFYLLSVASKEIYVPLPLVLLLYPAGNSRRRLQKTLPHWMILACYAIWRYLAFGGSLVGPKGLGAHPLDAITHLAAIPDRLVGGSVFLAAAAIAFTASGIARLRGRQWLFLPSILAALLLPLVPVAVNPGFSAPNRLLYLAWWAVCAAFSWSGFMIPARLQKPALLLMAGLCVSSALATVPWRQEIERSKRMWAEYYASPQKPGKGKNLYIPNNMEDGYFVISGNVSGMLETSVRLGLTREKKMNLITEKRAIAMLEKSSDVPQNSYIFDASVGRIRPANGDEELARWKNQIGDSIGIYLFRAIPRYGLQRAGHVDEIRQSANQLFISGWAPEGQLAVSLPQRCDSLGYEISDRPDVVAATGNPAWLRSGFRIALACPSAEVARLVAANLCVIAGARSFPAVLENPANSGCRKLAQGYGENDIVMPDERFPSLPPAIH
ncbi:MAG: hypothetical protein AB1648_16575 [Pseudomonadota bacterium]